MSAAVAGKRELTYITFQKSYSQDVSIYDNKYERNRVQKKHAREMEVKKHILQLVFAVSFIFIVLLFLNHSVSNASTGDDTIYFKYYTTIEVRPSETLSSIAKQYADEMHYESDLEYIEEVLFINHLEDADHIKAGTFLTVPYYSSEFK